MIVPVFVKGRCLLLEMFLTRHVGAGLARQQLLGFRMRASQRETRVQPLHRVENSNSPCELVSGRFYPHSAVDGLQQIPHKDLAQLVLIHLPIFERCLQTTPAPFEQR
jgi:hypothetical protein